MTHYAKRRELYEFVSWTGTENPQDIADALNAAPGQDKLGYQFTCWIDPDNPTVLYTAILNSYYRQAHPAPALLGVGPFYETEPGVYEGGGNLFLTPLPTAAHGMIYEEVPVTGTTTL